ncbi:rod-determining factor RdfA [Halorubrum sp. JWXQ-INN 858]|uniref:rod-determining factor RdfA n=1 Tax=Halorubrum sp. JWXQ-INN 858 TaxID=2690782 RepID=UPI001357D680|nr:rod-determining factor RdfA [Halorubrum sp. JWXQ-INN 858]
MSPTPEGKPNSKVARVIEKYDLSGWGDRLEREWLGEVGERTSLRDLAETFNRAVLAAALREAGEAVIEDDVGSTYRVLTGDDVSQADTLRKERDLERLGVDVDAVRSDFVTHQAVHSYLTDYREAELGDRSPDPDHKVDTLERLEGRTAAVAESTLEGLVRSGAVTDRSYELFVEVRTVCEDCGTGYALVDLIRRGGCDCSDEE